MTDELREALAKYAHQSWAGWMQYLLVKSHVSVDGSVTIPQAFGKRWIRQVETAYTDLPELEKESDRAEADRILAIFAEMKKPPEGG